MPKKKYRDWNLQGHPTHPLIPTQKYVKYNAKFPDGYVGNTVFYKQYPFKYTEAGRRSAVVASEELTDCEYSLTQGEWGEIMSRFGHHFQMYLLHGYTYKVPNWRLGEISLVKKKARTKNILLTHEHKHLDKPIFYNETIMAGYKVNVLWRNRNFRFANIWGIKFPGL